MLSADELDRFQVVLVGARNPLNIGAAARAMSNFGFLRLRVVHPFDAAFREARSAVDAAPVLAGAEEFSNLAEAVADCSLVVGTTAVGPRTPQAPVRSLEDGAQAIREHALCRQAARVALVFGSEKTGLSRQELDYCHLLLRIPTRAAHRSMNLGQAVAVCLYEMVRGGREQAPSAPGDGEPLATAGEIERLSAVLVKTLQLSGYPQLASAEEKLRRLIRRLPLTVDDTHEWLGLLRQIEWKLESIATHLRKED